MDKNALKNAIKRAAKKLSKQANGSGPILEFTIKNDPSAPFSISYRFDEAGDEYDQKKADECMNAFSHLLHGEIYGKN